MSKKWIIAIVVIVVLLIGGGIGIYAWRARKKAIEKEKTRDGVTDEAEGETMTDEQQEEQPQQRESGGGGGGAYVPSLPVVLPPVNAFPLPIAQTTSPNPFTPKAITQPVSTTWLTPKTTTTITTRTPPTKTTQTTRGAATLTDKVRTAITTKTPPTTTTTQKTRGAVKK